MKESPRETGKVESIKGAKNLDRVKIGDLLRENLNPLAEFDRWHKWEHPHKAKETDEARAFRRFLKLPERTRESLDRLPDLMKWLSGRPGRITRRVIIAALGAAALTPVVAAACAAWSAAAGAMLNQIGAFGAGYFTNCLFERLRTKHPDADLADEETVRRALGEMLLEILGTVEDARHDETASESRRHLAALLADPTIVGTIMTIAATRGRDLIDLRPDTSDRGEASHVTDDDWLLDEVIEALEDLARTPAGLEAALMTVYRQLASQVDGPHARNHD